MKKLEDLITKLKNIEGEAIRIIKEVVINNEAIILDMNIQDQLFQKGVNRLGIEISSYAPYKALTISIKKAVGQPTNRVTLKNEGDFYRGFHIQYLNSGFFIDSSDIKTESLVMKYGEEILGLTDENFQELLNNYVKPELIKLFKNL